MSKEIPRHAKRGQDDSTFYEDIFILARIGKGCNNISSRLVQKLRCAVDNRELVSASLTPAFTSSMGIACLPFLHASEREAFLFPRM